MCRHLLQHLDRHNILIHMNHAILDFSKAFDTGPHKNLLYKLDRYGIRGPNGWIKAFLRDRHMKTVVEQGTIIRPLLFLCHMTDLSDFLNSQVQLFADNCLIHRTIRNHQDHLNLQEDLHHLESWTISWGTSFNATKCYILSVKNRATFFYQLNNHILKQASNQPYL